MEPESFAPFNLEQNLRARAAEMLRQRGGGQGFALVQPTSAQGQTTPPPASGGGNTAIFVGAGMLAAAAAAWYWLR